MKNILTVAWKSLVVWLSFTLWVVWIAFASSLVTKSEWDVLTLSDWNNMVNSVSDTSIPSWAVIPFNLSTCPTGWSEFTQANWRTVIWAWSWAGSSTSVWDVGWEKSAPDISVTLSASTWGATEDTPMWWYYLSAAKINLSDPVRMYNNDSSNLVNLWWVSVQWAWTAPDNMQPYISLLYCQKS